MLENNLVTSGVYGEDAISESAKARIREACKAPEADVWFLVGGTQTNAVVLDSVLRPYEGVISVETGHICIHEAGAIEREDTRSSPSRDETGNSVPRTFLPAGTPGRATGIGTMW